MSPFTPDFMRFLRLFTFLLLVCPLLSIAQEAHISSHFGFKIGPSLTRLYVSGITPNVPKQKIDFHLGGMYRFRYNKFVLQPEVLYSVKGGTFQAVKVGGKVTTKNNYTYLSVPILLGYIPTEGITLQAGAEFSYALNAGTAIGPGQRNDVGLVIGAHYDFLDMLDKFSLHARYIYGLNNVAPPSDPSLAVDYRNRVFQVSMVYNFYKKRK
jgi:hypothetical protein